MQPHEMGRLLLAVMILGATGWIYVISLLADLWSAY